MVRLHADGSADQTVKGFRLHTPAEDHPMYGQSLKASEAILGAVKSNNSIDTNSISFEATSQDSTGPKFQQRL